MVSSSFVVLRTVPSTWSTRTRISLMSQTPFRSGSDELLGGEELGQRGGAGAVLVGDDLAGRPRRTLGGLLDLRPGHRQPDLLRLDTQVGQRVGLQRLLLRRHDPL